MFVIGENVEEVPHFQDKIERRLQFVIVKAFIEVDARCEPGESVHPKRVLKRAQPAASCLDVRLVHINRVLGCHGRAIPRFQQIEDKRNIALFVLHCFLEPVGENGIPCDEPHVDECRHVLIVPLLDFAQGPVDETEFKTGYDGVEAIKEIVEPSDEFQRSFVVDFLKIYGGSVDNIQIRVVAEFLPSVAADGVQGDIGCPGPCQIRQQFGYLTIAKFGELFDLVGKLGLDLVMGDVVNFLEDRVPHLRMLVARGEPASTFEDAGFELLPFGLNESGKLLLQLVKRDVQVWNV